MTSLESRYRTALAEDSDIVGHLAYFAELVTSTNATTVIELGTRTGRSSTAWLTGLEVTAGHLWSVDLDPQPFVHPRWTFVQGDDTDPAILAQLPDFADVIFVDTSHWLAHTLCEIDLYLPRLRPGGTMLFHDTDLDHYEVREALDQFFGADGWTNRPGSSGLGVVRT